MLRKRLLRLVFLDHDQSVRTLVQRVELDARFVMNPADRRFAGCDYLGAVLGDRKGGGDQDNAHSVPDHHMF
jgi:hypothetical protein